MVNNKIFSLLFIVTCLISCSKLVDFTNSKSVDHQFREFIKNISPGCAIAICKNGKPVYKKGYGYADVENQIHITTKTVFYAGSIGK